MKLLLELYCGYLMRDPQRQNRYGSSFTVSFPDFPGFTQLPYSLTLTQKMGSHDVLEMHYTSLNVYYVKALSTGVAVTVTWSNDLTSGTFIGYVSDLEYPTSSSIEKPLKITCLAASYPLKENRQKIWKNATASEVVTDIAKFNNLKPVVTKSDIRFPQISFSGQSQWQKVQELARSIGYACQVVGVELHFHPVDVMLQKSLTTIPVMAFLERDIPSTSQPMSQTLDHFESTQGDFGDFRGNSKSTKIVGGVDPLTGKVYRATSSPASVGKNMRAKNRDPLFSDVDTTIVVIDKLSAQSLSDAKAKLAKLSIPGYGFGQGDPRIAPWRTIQIEGSAAGSNGFWVTSKAVHTIVTDGKYTIEFECVTDGTGDNTTSIIPGAPTVDLNEALTTGANRPTRYKLSNSEPMTNESVTGYNVVPRRWVAV